MINPFSFVPSPYQLIAKVVTAVVLTAALWCGWVVFTGHYEAIGRMEVQVLWDKQKLVDAENRTLQILKIRAEEFQIQQALKSTITQLTKDNENVKVKADTTIANLRNGSLRVRQFACVPSTPSNKQDATSDPSGATTTYTVAIPREVNAVVVRANAEFETLTNLFGTCVDTLKSERE